MNDNFIDSIAAWGKFGVENSGRSRDEKEWAKSGVDCSYTFKSPYTN